MTFLGLSHKLCFLKIKIFDKIYKTIELMYLYNFIHWLYSYDIMKLSIRYPYHGYPSSNTTRTKITGGLR